MTTIAIIVLAVLLPFVLFDLLTKPTIRRLALRNVVRRPGEAALVVGGALLATALITASFIIGDSFGSSIRNLAVDRYGPVDEVVYVSEPSELEPTLALVQGAPDDLVDGAVGATFMRVAVASTDAQRMVEPEASVLEIEPMAAAAFSDDAKIFGPAPGTIGGGDVVINERLAETLGVEAGDPVDVFLAGEAVPMTVAAVRPATGLNGLGSMLAAPGTLTGLLDDPGAVSTSAVLVSNVGDVFSGAELTDEVMADLDGRLPGTVSVEPVKQDLLDDAEFEAADMTELFGTVGGFSVAAGILLVINLFVMLAGERKSEMGTLRATGLRRGHLVRAYSLEGAVYGLAAALVGTVVGIGVAAVVMAMAGNLFDGELTIRLAVVPASLLSGAVIGFAVSQLTVLITSWRVTRLNIVRALRDLPEPPSAGRSRRSLVFGVVGMVAGIALYVAWGTTPAIAMIAPALAMVSAVPILSRIIPSRIAVAGACGAALAWVAAVFGILPDVMDDPDIFLFLMQGVLLVGLATVIVGVGDRLWLSIVRRVTGGGIASRIGLAEPLARPVRTALLVAMYALVIFTVTFMAVMNSVFQAQAPDFAIEAGGGYDLYVDSNASSALMADDLTVRDDIEAVASVRRGRLTGSRPGSDADLNESWVSGVDSSFLLAGPPSLTARDEAFASDAEAWAAVTAGESFLIVDDDWGLDPGDEYLLHADDGSSRSFTVAGTTVQGWLVSAGIIVGDNHAVALFDDNRPPTRHYVSVVGSADATAVAAELTSDGVERGIDARTFLASAKAATDEQQGFLNLLQGYLGLGLLIGIAGLGVVLVRAVRERRRQFGVMRALGIAAPVVRRAFIVEAAFVAVQGVVLGIGLGMLSAWQVLTRSTAFEAGLSFTAPVLVLLGLGLSCLLASLLMASAPALRAGRTAPAVALRMTT